MNAAKRGAKILQEKTGISIVQVFVVPVSFVSCISNNVIFKFNKLQVFSVNLCICQVHLKASAAAASATEAVSVPGYYTLNPNITTGGGDHFNGGMTQ